jgi:hypothetical protein
MVAVSRFARNLNATNTMLDTRCWMLDAGCWMLDAGYNQMVDW